MPLAGAARLSPASQVGGGLHTPLPCPPQGTISGDGVLLAALTASAWTRPVFPSPVSCCNQGPRPLSASVLCSEVSSVPLPGGETGAQRTAALGVWGDPTGSCPGSPLTTAIRPSRGGRRPCVSILLRFPPRPPGHASPSLSGSSLGARGRCGPPHRGVLRAHCEGSWKKRSRGSRGSEEPGGLTGWHPCAPISGFKSFSLTSVELQMLTNSCVKLQTVHSIPLTINKEGGPPPPRTVQAAVPYCCWGCPGAGDLHARACVCSCRLFPGVDRTSWGDPGDRRLGSESRAAPQTLSALVWP